MFARSAVRTFQCAQAFKQPVRRFATEQAKAAGTPPPPPPPGNSSTTALLGVAVTVAAGGGYYFFGRDTSIARKAEAAVAAAAPAKKALNGEFVSLLLQDVETYNHNTKRFRFKLPEEDMVSGLSVASAVLTKFVPEGGKPVVRPYTPISDEDAKGYVDLLVKKYEGGPMSTHLHDMVPGQRLDIKGPLPKYPWTANKHAHIGLVAGGTGITPMWQLCRAVFSNPDDKTKVTLVLGNISEQDILLRQQLAELENTYPQRFRAFYVLDNPPKGWAGGSKGHITKELLKTVLPEPKTENIKLFVCGPPRADEGYFRREGQSEGSGRLERCAAGAWVWQGAGLQVLVGSSGS